MKSYGIADLGTVVQPEVEQQDIIVHKDIGHAESHTATSSLILVSSFDP